MANKLTEKFPGGEPQEFEFICFFGAMPPAQQKQHVEVLLRPGVTGVGIRKTGRRGDVFKIQTRRELEDQDAAFIEYEKYLTSIGKNPYKLEWNSKIYSQTFAVVNVSADSIRAATIVGGIDNDGSVHLLDATWELIMLDGLA